MLEEKIKVFNDESARIDKLGDERTKQRIEELKKKHMEQYLSVFESLSNKMPTQYKQSNAQRKRKAKMIENKLSEVEINKYNSNLDKEI